MLVSRDSEVCLVAEPHGRGEEPREAAPPRREAEHAAVHVRREHLRGIHHVHGYIVNFDRTLPYAVNHGN